MPIIYTASYAPLQEVHPNPQRYAKSAQHALPFFKLLRKETKFEWTEECEAALKHLKETLPAPPVLSRLDQGEVLYLYLFVSSNAVNAVLVRETPEGQKPTHVFVPDEQ